MLIFNLILIMSDKIRSLIDLYHSAAILSLSRIKSFVFARQASPRRKFSARLAVQKQSFYSPETQHGRRVITEVYFIVRHQHRVSLNCYSLLDELETCMQSDWVRYRLLSEWIESLSVVRTFKLSVMLFVSFST